MFRRASGPGGSRPAAALLLALTALGLESGCGAGSPRGAVDAAPETARCLPAGAVPGTPASIAEVVALVNALPRPVSVACFLESLARPLQVHANRSVFSFQPAVGTRSPRVFLFLGDGLIATVVPDGGGRDLLELGQFVDDKRTLKAELKFPVAAEVSDAEPFERVRDRAGTTCRACHFGEERAPEIGYAEAFTSAALRPDPRSSVELEVLRGEDAACDRAAEPARCALLRALFGHGELQARDFPVTLPTIHR